MTNRKISIVTGGAKGIGQSISEKLIKDNYFVIIADIDSADSELIIDNLGNNY